MDKEELMQHVLARITLSLCLIGKLAKPNVLLCNIDADQKERMIDVCHSGGSKLILFPASFPFFPNLRSIVT